DAPSDIAWSRNARNLISALHSTSGFGVRPAEYSRRNSANTRSLYSAEKLTASSSTPITSAAAAAAIRSWRVEQYSSSSPYSQVLMHRPTTSQPRRLSSSAATEESAPPDMPMTMRSAMANGKRPCAAAGLGGAAGIAADEVRHARDTAADGLVRRRVRETDVLSLAGDARAEMNVGEHRHAGFVEQAPAELLGVGRADHAAGLGDVRPGVEGAAGHEAGDARDPVEQPDDQVAPREERRAHLLGVVLRAQDRFDRRPLRDLRGARVGVRHPAHELGREHRVRREPEPPAGHGPGLGRAVRDDGALVHPGQRRD